MTAITESTFAVTPSTPGHAAAPSRLALVGQVLSRSGRLFLLDAVGGSDSAAKGISTLIVVCFYLISGGFIVLTMRISADSVTARQAIQLLASEA